MTETAIPEAESDGAERLAKRVARLKSCSRREAEQYIESGWVRVDGQIIEAPQFKVLNQKIEIDTNARLGAVDAVTLLLHKPAGYDAGPHAPLPMALITVASHSPEDRSGIRIINRHFAKQELRLSLEAAASGLVVLTQDFRVARKLSEDASKIEQEFVVEVALPDNTSAASPPKAGTSDAAELRAGFLTRLNRGIAFKERMPPYIKVSWQNETRLRFAMKDVQAGQIAHMCASFGLKVISMKRIRIGRIPMAGLQSGQWRYLGAAEKF
ncbi:MAG: rRNA pseudouridine synthase [Burkholderiales bacterium]